jgi:PTH2 family peptidyl-tRNA hydrolase
MEPEKSSNDLVMYIVVNEDLKMKPGKIASQVAHIAGLITEEIIEKSFMINPTPKECIDYKKWKLSGHAKIVLKASKQQMIELINVHKARYVIDEGRTQIEPESLTVVGFYPRSDMKETMKSFKLMN